MAHHNYSSFYIYGDTTRGLFLNGIKENAQENLEEIMLHCIKEIGVPVNHNDFVNAERIGKFNENRKWPR